MLLVVSQRDMIVIVWSVCYSDPGIDLESRLFWTVLVTARCLQVYIIRFLFTQTHPHPHTQTHPHPHTQKQAPTHSTYTYHLLSQGLSFCFIFLLFYVTIPVLSKATLFITTQLYFGFGNHSYVQSLLSETEESNACDKIRQYCAEPMVVFLFHDEALPLQFNVPHIKFKVLVPIQLHKNTL